MIYFNSILGSVARWVQHYAPEMEKRLRWYYRMGNASSWQIDETYIKVKGQRKRTANCTL
jgi:transposase-like protein